ncbi:MAG: phytoene/squalene synthase family protein [Hasllibacter sp.]
MRRTRPAIAPADMEACRAAIRVGSLSFHSASRLLPGRVRDPALALYAFCRGADDAVDEGAAPGAAVLALRARLDAIYAGRPEDRPEDRAFAAVVEASGMPRALPEALLEGLAWDAVGREYRTLPELHAYGARVAGAVGAMMCVLMGVRDRHALARACDLGAAMQLTNIARDVGEDAGLGRVYLPLDWLAGAGIERDAFVRDPLPTAPVRDMVRRLLAEARRLYFRAEAGIGALPLAARPGIWAARLAYDGIGGAVARGGHDSVSRRAATGRAAKAGWLAQAGLRTAAGAVMPGSAVLYADPLPEAAFLVDTACGPAPADGWGEGRRGALLAVLAPLEARDRAARMAAE